jgi:GWxTD domain-containing protein
VAFADEHFMDGSTRGSLTDRGMVFVLLGPPTGVARRPISTAEDNPTSAMGPIAGDKFPAPRPTAATPASDQLANWTEVWRYASEVLPSGIPDRYVDFAFIFTTRGDYGKKVLQRDSPSIRTLDAARPKPHPVD